MTPTTWDVFIALRDHVARNPELVAETGTTFLFKLSDPESTWLVDLKNARGAVLENGVAADYTLALSDRDFLDVAAGTAQPKDLFAAGKLNVYGDGMEWQKLAFLNELDPEQARAAVARARADGQGPGITPSAKATTKVRASTAPPDPTRG